MLGVTVFFECIIVTLCHVALHLQAREAAGRTHAETQAEMTVPWVHEFETWQLIDSLDRDPSERRLSTSRSATRGAARKVERSQARARSDRRDRKILLSALARPSALGRGEVRRDDSFYLLDG